MSQSGQCRPVARLLDGDGCARRAAGASTPENVVQACVSRVCELGAFKVEPFQLVEERIMFPLPNELLVVAQQKGVAVGAGNERAAERAVAEFKIRHH